MGTAADDALTSGEALDEVGIGEEGATESHEGEAPVEGPGDERRAIDAPQKHDGDIEGRAAEAVKEHRRVVKEKARCVVPGTHEEGPKEPKGPALETVFFGARHGGEGDIAAKQIEGRALDEPSRGHEGVHACFSETPGDDLGLREIDPATDAVAQVELGDEGKLRPGDLANARDDLEGKTQAALEVPSPTISAMIEDR